MKKVKAVQVSDAEILRMKREGQALDRQLVKDGIRTQESMFLFPREVVKASKIRHRGL